MATTVEIANALVSADYLTDADAEDTMAAILEDD